MKRPSFQFYPADWLQDTALRVCSLKARGLWMDMICYMHQGNPYGYLKVNHKVILPSNLAVMVGINLEEVERLLLELEEAGVFQKNEDGVIYSKRMVRDEELRNKRAAGGILGGNPKLLKKSGRLTLEDKQNPTPSSSSSSSNNNNSKELQPTVEISDTEKKEYGNKDINGILTALKKYSGVQDFKESQQQQRRYANHFLSLLKGTKERAPLPPEEIRSRVEAIVSDSFKGKNCNSIRYLYGEVKGFIVESRSAPRIITGIKK